MAALEVGAKQRQVRLFRKRGLIIGPCHPVGALEEGKEAMCLLFLILVALTFTRRMRFVLSL